ncbi:MAG: molecular chaperone HtpG [Chlorobi bacterium CHB2]|nr:molecular chaperone HtpG [Chlorobi bacterium CHB2]
MQERMEFQTEARQLLDLMIHSVYSNKDIVLRELISNSSDALDKLRIESLQNEQLRGEWSDPAIRIEFDNEARTVSITDNGIGMNRQEIVTNIGTIARSGTREFLTMLKSKSEGGEAVSADLIGQFGVGFYSTFMIADRVTLLTRRAGEPSAWQWESTGDGTYTIQEAERAGHGTTVTLHLKPVDHEDAMNDYADEWTIRSIIKKYSDFVSYPIQLRTEKPATDDDKNDTTVLITERGTVIRQETINSMKALWTRPASEIQQTEYNEFYKHIGYDWSDPLRAIHFRAEGTFEYFALLFIPSRAPMDLFTREGVRGLNLYVKRVFIMEDAKDLLPTYLRFVKGVVDSEDLPLNISREILQQNRQIQLMRKRITKKVLDTLGELRDSDGEKYKAFWDEFGSVVKEGVYQDEENREQLLGLGMFNTTNGEGVATLSEYIERMKEGQEAIWYITGENLSVLRNSPHLEAFRDRGHEVILLSDAIDAIWTGVVEEFKGKKFQSITRGDVDLGSGEEKKEQEKERKEKTQEFGSLLGAIKERLHDDVKEVRISNRLRSSAACLVADEHDMTPQMEKIMRAMGQEPPRTKRIMEVNPDHPVLGKLLAMQSDNVSDPQLGDYIDLLYGQAILAEGGELPDPARFSRLVANLMVKS